MFIRAARVDDARAICELHVAAIRQVCAPHYDAEAVEVWVAGKKPEGYVAAMATHVMLVAQGDGDEVVGFGELHVKGAEIRAVYVRPDRLRQGAGKALVNALEQAGRQHSLTRLQLQSTLNAIGFYEACGYVLVEMTTFRSTPEAALSCVKMHKDL